MKSIRWIVNLILICLLCFAYASLAQTPRKRTSRNKDGQKTAAPARSDDELKAELDAAIKLSTSERIARLQSFIEAYPKSALVPRATELLVSAHAAAGDEKLQANDATGGFSEFKQALALAPAEMSEKLYAEVVSQFPANLFLRGQRAEAIEIAHLIEAKVQTNAKRLLALAAFYLNIEQVDEAERVAESAVKLAPDLPAAHQALGAACRLALRLDDAAAEYARALELDPKSAGTRRSLADLRRATGKPEDALALYREQIATDAMNPTTRTGLVLSLFDANKREEAERELASALKDDPRNLALLVGAAYWYAAHGEHARALELAGQAVQLEPRYTWGQIALARALVAAKRPLDAERALRFAQQYGRFPTLSYELANALAASGLYEEAAEELARAFTIKDGEITTQLAGRTPAHASSFIELLAPERRASIFEATPADTDNNARVLKGLLALYLALHTPATTDQAGGISADSIAAVTNDFASGTDEMRVFRQLYAANRLLRRGVASETALELSRAARSGVEAAIDAPAATVATVADEIRDVRANAIAIGGTPDVPDVPRNTLSNILRGRIEELSGWALFNQGKSEEAVAALRRAVSVLPENSIYWRTAQWRLGTSLAASGDQAGAIAAYIKSYDKNSPDAARRVVIEALYTRVHGSLDGLDAQIGPAPARLSSATEANANASSTQTSVPTATTETTTAPVVTATPELKTVESRTNDTSATTNATTTANPTTTTTTPAPESTPTPLTASTQTSALVPAPESSSTPQPSPAPDKTPERVEPAPTPVQEKPRAKGECSFSPNVNAISINSGGSASVTLQLEGAGSLSDLDATTPNWADIVILREPQGSSDAAETARYTITSVSKTTGTFIVTFRSRCGTQKVAVTVN